MLQKPMLQKSLFQKSPPAAAAEAQVLPPEKALLAEKVFLAQRMEIVGQLTGGIAHDLHNVLTVITGTIGILAEAVADRPDLAAITGLIDQAAARGADLTAYLTAFTRGRSSQPAEVDVNALLVDVARLLGPTLGELIEIETVLASDVAPALIDPKRLMTAVLNLAIVIRDAMAEGGRLTFETANGELSAGDQIMIAVSASGLGASAGHPPQPIPDLGMTEDLVSAANGRVEIDRRAGHGTSVKIYLPRARGAATAPP
jgi:signal transduction histidine kinase